MFNSCNTHTQIIRESHLNPFNWNSAWNDAYFTAKR